MEKLEMFRVEWKNEKGEYKLLFKIYPTGIEFSEGGCFLMVRIENSTLKKFIDNLRKDSRIRFN